MVRTRRLPGLLGAAVLVAGMTSPATGACAAPPAAPPGAAAEKADSVEQIRAAIEAAHKRDGSGPFEGIVPFLAAKVETVHQPSFPNDGVIDGAKLGASLPLEHSLANAAIEGRRMDVTFTANGDQIRMKGVLTGRLRGSGKALVHPVDVVWTIANGRIVRFWVDASTPEIQAGYRLQAEAYSLPAVRPLVDAMRAALATK